MFSPPSLWLSPAPLIGNAMIGGIVPAEDAILAVFLKATSNMKTKEVLLMLVPAQVVIADYYIRGEAVFAQRQHLVVPVAFGKKALVAVGLVPPAKDINTEFVLLLDVAQRIGV